MKKIEINSRVDLYFSEHGFLFTTSLKQPLNRDLQKWSQWGYSWQAYINCGIKEKIFSFFDSMPEHEKTNNYKYKFTF